MSHATEIYEALSVLEIFMREARACQSARELVTKHDLAEMEKRIMSLITDQAAKIQANFDTLNTELDGIATGIAALDTLITGLQNSPGTLSPEDQAALDAIQAASGALATKAAAIVTAPPATAPTTPTPTA